MYTNTKSEWNCSRCHSLNSFQRDNTCCMKSQKNSSNQLQNNEKLFFLLTIIFNFFNFSDCILLRVKKHNYWFPYFFHSSPHEQNEPQTSRSLTSRFPPAKFIIILLKHMFTYYHNSHGHPLSMTSNHNSSNAISIKSKKGFCHTMNWTVSIIN